MLSIYPNPSHNSFKIDVSSLNNDGIFKLKIYYLLGTQLIDKKIAKGSSVIDISSLPNGTYFIKIESNNFTEVRKIIKI